MREGRIEGQLRKIIYFSFFRINGVYKVMF